MFFCFNTAEKIVHEMSTKRSRGANFSAFEKELSVELVAKYKETIECKKGG